MLRLFPSGRCLSSALFILLAHLPAWAAGSTIYSSPAYTVSLVAGVPGGSKDGPAGSARFSRPTGTVVDSAGNVFVVDADNATIRKIAVDGTVSTLAGQAGAHDLVDGTGAGARFSVLHGIAIDRTDNLYVLDFGQIRKITPAGSVTTLPGVILGRFSGDSCLAVDSHGVIYVSDGQSNSIFRYVDTVVTTFVGGSAGYQDGPGSVAQFYGPAGVAIDAADNLYVADQQNCTVRKITPAGDVSTYAGTMGYPGYLDGVGTAAGFWYPQGIAVDNAGNVYVADWGNSTIRKILPDRTVSTLAGKAGAQGSNDGAGNFARFNEPVGLAVSRIGDVYVADTTNNTIRKITPDGHTTTYAGLASSGSDNGPALAAHFQYPSAVASDRQGNVYVADRLNNLIRKIDSTQTVTTLAGVADGSAGYRDGAGKDTRFWWPTGIAVDDNGYVYVADSMNNLIRKVSPDGTVGTVAGVPFEPAAQHLAIGEQNPGGSNDGPAAQAQFYGPTGVALDPAGNLYVADQWNHTIRKITPAGVVSTLAGQAGSSGTQDGQGSAARFNLPTGIAADAQGVLYITDQLNHTIRRITPQGNVTTLAGIAGSRGSEDGPAGTARFNNPTGIAVDQAGNVYVADYGNDLIRWITPAGAVSTIAGYAGLNGYGHSEINSAGFSNGAGPAARFNYPFGISVNAKGVLYIADAENNAIRKADSGSVPTITTQPKDQTVATGGSVQFSVEAAGAAPLAYQWYFGGNPYQGATSSTLSFSNARAADAGEYSVVVSNPAGSVTSGKATLTVTTSSGTPPPAGSSGSSGGGGGGGGAPSWWFFALLGALCVLRSLRICFRHAR